MVDILGGNGHEQLNVAHPPGVGLILGDEHAEGEFLAHGSQLAARKDGTVEFVPPAAGDLQRMAAMAGVAAQSRGAVILPTPGRVFKVKKCRGGPPSTFAGAGAGEAFGLSALFLEAAICIPSTAHDTDLVSASRAGFANRPVWTGVV